MQRLILGLLPLFFIVFSCKKQVPDGILPQEDMVELMTEVHILDGYISNIPVDSAKKVIDPLYEQLFAKFGIDSAKFTKNVNYYFGNPSLTVKTYDQVVKTLEKRERSYYSQDSLKNLILQDSMSRVTRMQVKLQTLNNMILNAEADSADLSIADRTRRFYEPVGLMRFWEKNILEKKAPMGTETPDISTLPIPENTTPETSPEVQKPTELKPQDNLDTIPFRHRNERLKPVTRPRERPIVQ